MSLSIAVSLLHKTHCQASCLSSLFHELINRDPSYSMLGPLLSLCFPPYIQDLHDRTERDYVKISGMICQPWPIQLVLGGLKPARRRWSTLQTKARALLVICVWVHQPRHYTRGSHDWEAKDERRCWCTLCPDLLGEIMGQKKTSVSHQAPLVTARLLLGYKRNANI